MRYFKLFMDDTNDDDVVAFCHEDHGFESYELDEAKEIQGWDNPINFYYDPEEGNRKTDYLGNDEAWFMISPKFKSVIDQVGGTNVQYLPVNVINEKDGSTHQYYVANILETVDALNLEHSDYFTTELDDGRKVYSITKYAIDEKAAEGHHLFKLKKYNVIPFFISERLRDEILSNGITGCDFLEVRVV